MRSPAPGPVAAPRSRLALLLGLVVMAVLAVVAMLVLPASGSSGPAAALSGMAAPAAQAWMDAGDPDMPPPAEHRREPLKKPRPLPLWLPVAGDPPAAGAPAWPASVDKRPRLPRPLLSVAAPRRPDPGLRLHPGQAPPAA